MSVNSVPRTRKTIYIRLEGSTVEMLERLTAEFNVHQDTLITYLIDSEYDRHLANIAKMNALKEEKTRLLAQIEEIDKQLPPQ